MVLERECEYLDMRDWYKAQTNKLGQTPLFKFFNEQRVHTIHKGVIKPSRVLHEIESAEYWYETDEKGVQKLRGHAIVKTEQLNISSRDITQVSSKGTVSAWRFSGVEKHLPNDSGNVLRLCENYYRILKWLVEEWYREQYRLGIRGS